MRAQEFITERKKRSKKTRGLGGYFFPGYGFYGGDSGEGGGDGGGGGESKQGMLEAMAADQVLDYVKRTHAPDEFNIEYSITDHPEWELKTIPLSQLNLDPDGEAQDPYNRVNWVDDDKVQELIPRIGSVLKSNPIVVDPAGWIIDGNHRAMAAAEAGLTSVPALVPVKQGVTENIPQPGESSGAPKQFGPDAKIQTRQMTVKQIISSVPGLPYYNNVVDDWDAKDYSWGVTKKVIEYATYLKQHPESLSQLPPILVLNGKFEDGAHRVSAIWLLQQRMDPKNPLWANAKLNVQFVKQGVAEGKITLSTDPNWYGATLDNYQASGPVVNIPANQLVGFEPDDKMNQPKSKVNVEKIVAGLKQGAKLPPLLVRKYKNGYQVLDGHHRFWAYKLLGVKSIPAQIVPDSDIEEISKQGMAEGLNFDEIYGKYLKVTDNNGDPSKPGFSLVTPLNGDSWNWRERPEFKDLVKQKLNNPGFLGDHKYQQIVDAMSGKQFDSTKHIAKENFHDGKNPQDRGDSARHGIAKKSSLSSLDKIVHSKTASPRKKQLAHWQANMRRGRAKS